MHTSLCHNCLIIGVGTGGQGAPNIIASRLHAVQISVYYGTCVPSARGGYQWLCVGAESNAPVDSNAGEPSRCTSDIEDGTSVESSTDEPSCTQAR